jgi:hypothetical protein
MSLFLLAGVDETNEAPPLYLDEIWLRFRKRLDPFPQWSLAVTRGRRCEHSLHLRYSTDITITPRSVFLDTTASVGKPTYTYANVHTDTAAHYKPSYTGSYHSNVISNLQHTPDASRVRISPNWLARGARRQIGLLALAW